MDFKVERNNIARMQVDAVVLPAKSSVCSNDQSNRLAT